VGELGPKSGQECTVKREIVLAPGSLPSAYLLGLSHYLWLPKVELDTKNSSSSNF